jgi:hypothetical protein
MFRPPRRMTSLAVKALGQRILGDIQTRVHLEAQLELRRHAEIAAQAQRRIRRDAAFAQDNLIDAARRHANVQRQAILAQVHGLEKLFQQHFARVHRLEVFLAYVTSLS